MQLPGFQIIGLPAPEVAEARERIRAAIETSGFEFPRRRVVLNLSPASIRKRGTGMDLGMALAVLAASYETKGVSDCAAWGELSLQGEVKSLGQITRTLYAVWRAGIPKLILAQEDFVFASRSLEELKGFPSSEFPHAPPALFGVSTLAEAWTALRSQERPTAISSFVSSSASTAAPSSEVGHLIPLSPSLERTVGLAAAGAHHLLLLGPRGTGKSHALEWLIELQPEASASARIHQSLLAELAGTAALKSENGRITRRVGPQARPAALIGSAGPDFIRPGELSLADGGLLVADEFLEWPRDSREVLREPLERGFVCLTRAHARLELPARFTLAASANLCPCGGWPPQFSLPAQGEDLPKAPRCTCTTSSRAAYLAKLSGPVLDRLDLVTIVASQTARRKRATGRESASELLSQLRHQVHLTRQICRHRWGSLPGELEPSDLEKLLKENPKLEEALDAVSAGSLRARQKILRVAMTLSAWDGAGELGPAQLMEASCYRPERLGLCD